MKTLLTILLLLISTIAWGADTGRVYGTVATYDTTNTLTWGTDDLNDTNEVLTLNATPTYIVVGDLQAVTTKGLWVTHFNFADVIPAYATIDGILVEFYAGSQFDGGTYSFQNVYLCTNSNSTSLIGDNKGSVSIIDSFPFEWTSDNGLPFGGSSDTWGVVGGLDRDDLISDTFGVAFNTSFTDMGSSGLGDTYQIDVVAMTVYYTEGSAPPSAKTSVVLID